MWEVRNPRPGKKQEHNLRREDDSSTTLNVAPETWPISPVSSASASTEPTCCRPTARRPKRVDFNAVHITVAPVPGLDVRGRVRVH